MSAALQAHRRVLEVDPDTAASALELGRLQHTLGDEKGAKLTFERMISRLEKVNSTSGALVATSSAAHHRDVADIFRAFGHHFLGVQQAQGGSVNGSGSFNRSESSNEEAASGAGHRTAAALRHFRAAFDADPLGIYMAAHNLQVLDEVSEIARDGSIVDLSIPHSLEHNVKLPVSTASTAHCPICDGSTVRRGAFFVEIGTADHDSLAHRFFTEGWWSGVSVEPMASYLARLPSRPGLAKVNAAVSEVDGQRQLYTVPEETIRELGLPEYTRGLSSLLPDHADVRQNPAIQEHFRPVLVPSITFETLSRHFGQDQDGAPRRIDLLHVDTEGYDANIVHQALEYAHATCGYPRHIKFEWVHVPNEEQRGVLRRLARSGYRCYFKAKDVQCTYATCVGSGGLMWQEGV
jgi:hypothetical protein